MMKKLFSLCVALAFTLILAACSGGGAPAGAYDPDATAQALLDSGAFSETLEVEFDEGRMVEYSFKQLEELELAYAITIHKSQGSEYPAVVIPIYSGPRMLMTRNLIYTAVTRAKKCVCLVGLPEMFQFMVENEMEQKRYSGLKDRILEIEPGI